MSSEREDGSSPPSTLHPPRPNTPVTAELIWSEELRFNATSGTSAIVVDSDSVAGPSPMKLVAIGLAGCMAIDVLTILQRGRHPVSALRVSLTGERTPHPPRRYVAIDLHFDVTGAVAAGAVERAIALSRDKYCSVWHSLRQDIDLTTAYHIVDGS